MLVELAIAEAGWACRLIQLHNTSRSLDVHECSYGISELETLGLVWAVKHFRPYILGHRTTVYTDHAACMSYLLKTARLFGKLARCTRDGFGDSASRRQAE
jgi:hypothetical protein